jgi:hypothetical protein
MNTLKAHYLLAQNIRALLATRSQTAEAVAKHCKHEGSWLSKILAGDRSMNIRDLDCIASFFEIEVVDLFRPGLAPLLERRHGQRRSGVIERRVSDRRHPHTPLPPSKLPRLHSTKAK